MLMSFSIGLIAGPPCPCTDRPTVSPVTDALCASDPCPRARPLRCTSWRCPGSAAGGHRETHTETRHDRADQQPPERLRAEHEADQRGTGHGINAGATHLAQRGGRDDVHAGAVCRACRCLPSGPGSRGTGAALLSTTFHPRRPPLPSPVDANRNGTIAPMKRRRELRTVLERSSASLLTPARARRSWMYSWRRARPPRASRSGSRRSPW